MALVSMEQAFTHLRISGDEYFEDVTLKLAIAEAQVITYLKRAAEDLSEAETAIVQGAILEVLANIFVYDRGDREDESGGPITPRVVNALGMLRDRTLA